MEENNNGTPTKNSKKGLVLVLAIIVIALLAGAAYYFLGNAATPKDVFVGGIEKIFETSTKKLGEDIKKINTTVSLSGNIESSNEEVSKIAEYINQGKLTYNVQLDTEAKKAMVNLSVDYKNENLLNGKVYYASGDENVYLFVQDLFDKYFKVNVKEVTGDEEGLSSFESLFNGEIATANGKVDTKKAANIIKEALKKNLKDEYFTKENVDGLTKNTMKLTVGELKALAKNIITELKDNQEFIACFEKQDEVKKELEETVEEFTNLSTEEDNKNVEISMYTNRNKSLSKLEIIADIKDSQQLTMTILETEKGKYELNADVPELGKVKLNIEVKEEAATEIENVNTADSVDVNNMTQADQLKLLGNLMNMKLYQYLAPLMQSGM